MPNNEYFNLTLEVKHLLHVLIFANSVVEKRNILVELSHIKLSVENNILEVTATDRDLTLIQKINVQGFTDGQTSVPSSTFTEIIRKIYDKEITLKQKSDSDQLEIIGKNCNFKLVTLPANSFPSLEEMNVTLSLKILCKDFLRLIDHTQFSMSNEETRYNLNGIFLHNNPSDNSLVKAAATDGHRLSVATIDHVETAANYNIIIPRKAVQEITKIIKDPQNINGDLEILIGVNKVKFICNHCVMISKLIDGTFPEYNQFIPQNNPNKLIINNKIFASSIDRVSTVTVDKFRAIKINLNQGGVKISAFGEAKGSAEEFLPYSNNEKEQCNYTGDNITIGFNPRYLLDVLNIYKDEMVEIYFNDQFSPALIKFSSFPNDNFVVMPIKV